jgi:acyl-CoA thioester hydrolase
VQLSHETTVRVRYAETDRMGVVYHSNFFIWFEVGRVELLRSLGFSYRDMEQNDDRHLPVVEGHCRYERPARYDDVLRIRTSIKQSTRRTLRFSYEAFHDATGERLATGETLHVVCDGQGKPRVLPEKYRNFVPLVADGTGAPSGRSCAGPA